MKLMEKWKAAKKRNKVLIGLLCAGLILGGVGFGIYRFVMDKSPGNPMPERNRMENGSSNTGEFTTNSFVANGTTATDMVTKQLEIDSLETSLYVEEVYVSSGDTIATGDKLLKLTDESVEEARKELKQKATEAEVAYQEQKMTYEEGVIEARKNADISVIEGKFADKNYELEMEVQNRSLEDLQTQAEEALELYEEYQAAVTGDYYRNYYKVDELQQEANDPFAYLNELYSDWNIEEAEEAMKNGGGSGMGGSMEELDYDPEQYSLYQDFDAAVTNMLHELEDAKENYKEATEKAAYSLEAAQADYALKEATVQKAIAELEQTKVILQAECDVAKAEAELAESAYEAEVKQLQEELNKVSDENDIAQENLRVFEEMMGDGCLYATEDGEIMMLNAAEGRTLDLSLPYLVYSDSSNVTVTVSIDQAYIASVSVGDLATVMISDLGTYEGEITSINPVAQSESRSSVSYSVIVTLKGDLSDVTSNLTATVMFGNEKDEGEQRKGEEDKERNNAEKMESGQVEGNPAKPQEKE